MTKEPQPTTHNAKREARGMCRERSGTGSSPKRTEKKVCCMLIDEISWRFGVKCLAIWGKPFGNLEKTYSVILGEDVLSNLEKLFGDNVRDLEKCGWRGYGDFELEFAME